VLAGRGLGVGLGCFTCPELVELTGGKGALLKQQKIIYKKKTTEQALDYDYYYYRPL